MGKSGSPIFPGNRSNIDNAALALLFHRRNSSLTREKYAFDIHRKGEIPCFLSHGFDLSNTDDACVTRQNMQPPEAAKSFFYHANCIFFLSHVRLNGETAAP